MAGNWRIDLDDRAWDGHRRLFVSMRGAQRHLLHVAPLHTVPAVDGEQWDTPTLEETRADREDGLGDVEGFLQAALDLAWSIGMRPRGFADHTNELKAVRDHLADMRKLAKVT